MGGALQSKLCRQPSHKAEGACVFNDNSHTWKKQAICVVAYERRQSEDSIENMGHIPDCEWEN